MGWSWILFSLATADIIIAFLQVYRPLTNDTILSSPTAWDLSWAVPDKLEIAHNEVYTTCVFAQDLLLVCVSQYIPATSPDGALILPSRSGGSTSFGVTIGRSRSFLYVLFFPCPWPKTDRPSYSLL